LKTPIDFFRNKYDKEILIDCFLKSDELDITKPSAPFFITFYEIIFVLKGEGTILLDHESIHFKAGTVLFLPPNKWRQWTKLNAQFDAYYLIFEEEFIATFFNDPLYLYRFNYFYNTNTPSFLELDENKLKQYVDSLLQVKTEIESLKEDSNHMLRALLYALLINLNRDYEKTHQVKQSFYKETNVLKFRMLL